METAELASPYAAKTIEYLIAVAYLLLFVPFWRFVQAHARPVVVPARVAEAEPAGWFDVPEALGFHLGHGWARADAQGLVTLGADDFAQKLVGPLAGTQLPPVGSVLAQGEPGWRLKADGHVIDMLAPMSGRVVEVNPEVERDPGAVNRDPYGAGWLVKLSPVRLAADTRQLLSGALARKWMEGVAESLASRLRPELGLVLQDGGVPVQGVARALDPEHWDDVAREYLGS